MKKLLFCLLVVALSATAVAQERSTLGVRVGMNISNLSMKTDGAKVDLKSRVGFNIGISYQTPLVSNLFLETGLSLTSRGARIASYPDFIGDAPILLPEIKINMLYAQLPVTLSWHFDLKNVSIQPFLGGYYSLGVHGKAKVEGYDQRLNLFRKTKIGELSVSQIFSRSDAGLRFGVGVVFLKKYEVSVGYDLGLTNMIKEADPSIKETAKNGNVAITLGYNF